MQSNVEDVRFIGGVRLRDVFGRESLFRPKFHSALKANLLR
jgi:hypothetical protein